MDEYTSIGYLLNKSAHLVRQDLGNRMNSLGLTFPQWTVLKDLSHHQDCAHCDLTMAAIARRLSTRRPNVLGILDRLENMDLAQRTVNPHNRRAHIVSLTDKAQKVMAGLQELSHQTSALALQGFSREEETALKSHLTRIITNLEEAAENSLEGRDSK